MAKLEESFQLLKSGVEKTRSQTNGVVSLLILAGSDYDSGLIHKSEKEHN
jgi:hypothetical protein